MAAAVLVDSVPALDFQLQQALHTQLQLAQVAQRTALAEIQYFQQLLLLVVVILPVRALSVEMEVLEVVEDIGHILHLVLPEEMEILHLFLRLKAAMVGQVMVTQLQTMSQGAVEAGHLQ